MTAWLTFQKHANNVVKYVLYYVYNKYLFHNIVSTLSQRYAMTQHLSNVVWMLYTKQPYHSFDATL